MPSVSSSMPVSIPESVGTESVGGVSDQAAGVEDVGLGLYVHWPFCISKCPYCDFNSHVRESIDQERWGRALVNDLESALAAVSTDVLRPLLSIFFGGGTPSLMAPETVAAVLDVLSSRGLLNAQTEITLEANPSSADAERFAAYRDAGVNRLSIGVQALDNEALRFLGRAHDVDEALDALAAARATFSRVSFDLIYARTGQSPQAWRAELERVLALEPAHVSLYQLTIERGTRFYEAQARGNLTVPGDDDAATMYEDTLWRCKEIGLAAYEVSNFARPGEECRHNLIYWRSGDWIGVGPGAHGRMGQGDGRVATRQWRSPEKWLDAVENTGTGFEASEVLDAPTRATEMLMMGLRLTEGVSAERFERMVGETLQDTLIRDRLDDLVEGGFMEVSQHGVRTTRQGRNVLNTLVSQLLP
jgi:putative oxygen-independent coproporphyrinogen III oxidase